MTVTELVRFQELDSIMKDWMTGKRTTPSGKEMAEHAKLAHKVRMERSKEYRKAIIQEEMIERSHGRRELR
jgi:hypothetical protein